MAFSMDAARLHDSRTVCDVCDATSSAPRGSVCRTCTVGTLRYRSELQVLRAERKAARAAARDQLLR
jgi:ribosomal protein L40E